MKAVIEEDTTCYFSQCHPKIDVYFQESKVFERNEVLPVYLIFSLLVYLFTSILESLP